MCISARVCALADDVVVDECFAMWSVAVCAVFVIADVCIVVAHADAACAVYVAVCGYCFLVVSLLAYLHFGGCGCGGAANEFQPVEYQVLGSSGLYSWSSW